MIKSSLVMKKKKQMSINKLKKITVRKVLKKKNMRNMLILKVPSRNQRQWKNVKVIQRSNQLHNKNRLQSSISVVTIIAKTTMTITIISSTNKNNHTPADLTDSHTPSFLLKKNLSNKSINTIQQTQQHLYNKTTSISIALIICSRVITLHQNIIIMIISDNMFLTLLFQEQ